MALSGSQHLWVCSRTAGLNSLRIPVPVLCRNAAWRRQASWQTCPRQPASTPCQTCCRRTPRRRGPPAPPWIPPCQRWEASGLAADLMQCNSANCHLSLREAFQHRDLGQICSMRKNPLDGGLVRSSMAQGVLPEILPAVKMFCPEPRRSGANPGKPLQLLGQYSSTSPLPGRIF